MQAYETVPDYVNVEVFEERMTCSSHSTACGGSSLSRKDIKHANKAVQAYP